MDQIVPADAGASEDQETPFPEFFRQLQRRDEPAWEALVRRYWPALRAVAQRRLHAAPAGAAVSADDVLQSSFELFYRSCDCFHAVSWEHLVSFLAGIVWNVASNSFRQERAARRNRGRVIDDDVSQLPVTDRAKSPSRTVEDRELAAEVRARLSTCSREIAERRADGESWKQIAQELRISPDAARMRLRRKREQLLKSTLFADYREGPADGSEARTSEEDYTPPKPR